MNNRRKLLVAFCAGALADALSSFAQQQDKVWRVGSLLERAQTDYGPQFPAFAAGMRELGYTEGRHYVIEHRSAQTDFARLPALAAELIALKVDLILSSGTPSAVAARNATREIPILIITVGDPIGAGLAQTLAHPGGNVTGVTALTSDLVSKRLDLLRQLSPGMSRVAMLYDPNNFADALSLKRFESDCAKLGLKSTRASVRKAEEIGAAFNTLARDKVQGLIVTNSNNITVLREIIIEQTMKYRLPAIYGSTRFVESGGLITYSANTEDLYRRAAAYAVKIFKGAKPGDLPIEQPIKFEMVLNLKTAKALDIKIPDVIMLRVDKVIE